MALSYNFPLAFDTLAIPVMSSECEKIFSSAKKLLTPERNALADDIIEATECSKAWWAQGLIQQQDVQYRATPRVSTAGHLYVVQNLV